MEAYIANKNLPLVSDGEGIGDRNEVFQVKSNQALYKYK